MPCGRPGHPALGRAVGHRQGRCRPPGEHAAQREPWLQVLCSASLARKAGDAPQQPAWSCVSTCRAKCGDPRLTQSGALHAVPVLTLPPARAHSRLQEFGHLATPANPLMEAPHQFVSPDRDLLLLNGAVRPVIPMQVGTASLQWCRCSWVLPVQLGIARTASHHCCARVSPHSLLSAPCMEVCTPPALLARHRALRLAAQGGRAMPCCRRRHTQGKQRQSRALAGPHSPTCLLFPSLLRAPPAPPARRPTCGSAGASPGPPSSASPTSRSSTQPPVHPPPSATSSSSQRTATTCSRSPAQWTTSLCSRAAGGEHPRAADC